MRPQGALPPFDQSRDFGDLGKHAGKRWSAEHFEISGYLDQAGEIGGGLRCSSEASSEARWCLGFITDRDVGHDGTGPAPQVRAKVGVALERFVERLAVDFRSDLTGYLPDNQVLDASYRHAAPLARVMPSWKA